MTPDVVCVGAVLWDILGRAERPMRFGNDVPGLIVRTPGGVALNIALALRRAGLAPALLSSIGRDAEGDDLVAACERAGLLTAHIHRDPALPTDRYLAVEDVNGLVAAIADAHSLERAGARILAPLVAGPLGTAAQPWRGLLVVDGNLTAELIAEIAASPLFTAADLRVAPASPGKAERLRPLLRHPRATFYVNLEEAGVLCGATFADAPAAAAALVQLGATRVLVTNGGRASADARHGDSVLSATPPPVQVRRVTGAGDTFMAGHIAAERRGADRPSALAAALTAASVHIAGEIGSS